MCYESDGLFRKLRAFEQLRKDREKAEVARTEAARQSAKTAAPKAPSKDPLPAIERPTVAV
jgi:hypothetical protein